MSNIQYDYLLNKAETDYLGKEQHAALASRKVVADIQLDEVDSALTHADVSIRNAEHNMRNLLVQKRVE